MWKTHLGLFKTFHVGRFCACKSSVAVNSSIHGGNYCDYCDNLIPNYEPYSNRNMESIFILDSLDLNICTRESPLTLLREIHESEIFLQFFL